MMFEGTVHLGDILQSLAILGGGIVVFVELRQNMKSQGRRLDGVEDEIKKQTEILISIGRQDEQLKGQRQQLEEYGVRLLAIERKI